MPAHVRLSVYDILGREVARLVDGAQPAGFYHLTFNASQFASGIYFYRMTAAGYSAQKSMIHLK